jgi:DNA polymerase IV
MPLLARFLKEGHRIRGIGLHTVQMTAERQLELFFQEDEKMLGMYHAVDRINNKFGLDTITQAASKYSVEGKTHFLDRNNQMK